MVFAIVVNLFVLCYFHICYKFLLLLKIYLPGLHLVEGIIQPEQPRAWPLYVPLAANATSLSSVIPYILVHRLCLTRWLCLFVCCLKLPSSSFYVTACTLFYEGTRVICLVNIFLDDILLSTCHFYLVSSMNRHTKY